MTKGQYLWQASKRLTGNWNFKDGKFTKYIDMHRYTGSFRVTISTDGWSGYKAKAECYGNPQYSREEQTVKDMDGLINYVAEYAEYLDGVYAVMKAKEILKNAEEAR